MEADFWHQRWQQQQIGFHQQQVNPLLSRHWSASSLAKLRCKRFLQKTACNPRRAEKRVWRVGRLNS